MSAGPLVQETALDALPLYARGKVRDTYDLGDRLLMVATDRISAFDVVLPTPIPHKGWVLTQMSLFWFKEMASLIPHHLDPLDPEGLPAGLLPEARAMLAGRTMRVRKAQRVDVECVVRGYLSGSGWKDYQQSGAVCGHVLPPGLRLGERLPAPIFTPSTKALAGHDQNISRAELAEAVGAPLAQRLEAVSLAIYARAAAHAERCGLILADTKTEFGFVKGQLSLIDELLTPDSSRFWERAAHSPGTTPPSFDKQPVRDYLERLGWDKRPPAPHLPPEVVAGTEARYLEVFRRVTGRHV
jgi:phosphoribosylaminoimidazole-succinocarboxamide synthase